MLLKEELISKGDELAQVTREINELEIKKQMEAKAIKEQIDKLNAMRLKLAEQVKSKTEERSVECEERFDFDKRLAMTVRRDTYEVVHTRAMTMGEFQEEMDLHMSPTEA